MADARDTRLLRVLVANDHLGHQGGAAHGVTTYLLAVLPRLRQANVQVVPCFLGPYHPAAERLVNDGVEPRFLERGKWDLRALSDMLALVREHDINLIHAAGLKGMLLARIIGRMSGIPVITHFHDQKPLGVVFRTLFRMTAAWSAAALAVSRSVARFVVKELHTPEARVTVLHNGVDTTAFGSDLEGQRDRLRQEFAFPSDATVVGIIGRLSPEKGHQRFLETVPAMLRARPGIRVLIVGDGVCRRHLESVVDVMGLADIVRFAGFRRDIPAVLTALDVVAIPSFSDGFPYVALEAMAARRPVVAHAIGGIPETVRDGETGLLVEPDDPDGFPRAIARLCSEGRLRERLVGNGRRLVAQMSIDNHVAALLNLYRKLSCTSADRAMRVAE
ncbi:glycosyltransferase family 4 protein [Methylonatrum kenyense]|uniref:glycosyltransferase family 4 protein n=1 Tax=Methylonatrum kenyense TaxID=455253 RepID=UPI0020BD5736|nr:glycosyltransferase family 4 protein [Methylonatrum kenyense]MCK8516805.1 glycosyltransferase family 4 protein [Methylonatrum kenyense]